MKRGEEEENVKRVYKGKGLILKI